MTPPRNDDRSPPPATTKALRTENSEVNVGYCPLKKGAHQTPMPKPAQNRNAVAANSWGGGGGSVSARRGDARQPPVTLRMHTFHGLAVQGKELTKRSTKRRKGWGRYKDEGI